MSTERAKSHGRITEFMIQCAKRKPVTIEPTCGFSRAHTGKPFYFAWLPGELTDRILDPENFVSVPGNFTMPLSHTLDERTEVFRYIDDLLALRLVSRSFAHKFKAKACTHCIRWMMHAKPYTPDMKWMFAMHCTVSMLTRTAPTMVVAGDVAFGHLKTALITRMMTEKPRDQIQPTVDEVCASALVSTPRF